MSKKTKEDTQEVDIVEGADVAEQIVNEQASLALANMLSRGVKMADAKKRLGIK